MDELVRWLTAQFDEDERIAQEAGGAAWEELPVSGWVHTSALPDTEWQPPGYDHHVASAPLPADRAHIVAHDPARVLREIDAKRRMLTDVAAASASALDMEHGCCHEPAQILAGECPQFAPSELPLVRLLALPYSDRPGYAEALAATK